MVQPVVGKKYEYLEGKYEYECVFVGDVYALFDKEDQGYIFYTTAYDRLTEVQIEHTLYVDVFRCSDGSIDAIADTSEAIINKLPASNTVSRLKITFKEGEFYDKSDKDRSTIRDKAAIDNDAS